MEKLTSIWRSEPFRVFALLALVSGLAYLPFVAGFGYFNDDWYLMYAAGARGVSVFADIFSIDRPGRVLVMVPAWLLFGGNPLYYNLSAYLFRLAGGLGFCFLLRHLWRRQRTETVLMALLFLVYPGFLNQPNAIDYQSHIVGLAAAVFSLALTLKAVLSRRGFAKVVFFALSTLLGWFALWQMEWYIGFEFLRWAAVFLLANREARTLWRRLAGTLRAAWPVIAVPALFLLWRIAFFKPERGATDLGLQLDNVIQSPLRTGLTWLASLFSDSLDVLLLAWGAPLSSLLAWVWSRDLLLVGLALGAAALGVFLYFLRQFETTLTDKMTDWRPEALWLGGTSALAGLLPVILVNRSVDFGFYSRYSLVSSAGAVVFLVALLYSLESLPLRKVLAAGLVLVAVFTHYANSQRAVQVTQATREFWWQVSWRIPQLEKNTTLVTSYPQVAIEEDYFIWGPASLIYFPQQENPKFIQPGVFAALLNQDTVTKTLLREGQEFDNRRTIRTYKNYRNLLVLTQPGADSCVQVIDGAQPVYSRDETASIRVIGPFSEIEHILVNLPASPPPALVFGPEPKHGWCYYYQKASLAKQRGEWGEIVQLGKQVQGQGLEAGDLVEWMPFLEAYAHEGQASRLETLSPLIAADAYAAQQACQTLGGMQGLAPPVMDVIQAEYCIEW